MAKMGRPTKYTEKLVNDICEIIAQGKSMRYVARLERMPSVPTMFTWLRTYPYFLKRYTIAKQESADAMTDEILAIADEDVTAPLLIDGVPYVDPVTGEQVRVVTNAAVQHARLRIESRKWIAAKLKPEKYSESMTTKHQALDSNGEPTNWTVQFKNANPVLQHNKDDEE